VYAEGMRRWPGVTSVMGWAPVLQVSDEVWASLDAARRPADEVVRQYHRLSEADLASIAELFRHQGTRAVARRFEVSHRQASRYVAKARQAGVL
jgi:hypothetical protein